LAQASSAQVRGLETSTKQTNQSFLFDRTMGTFAKKQARRDLEIQVLRKEVETFAFSRIPVVIVYTALAVLPQFAYLRGCSLAALGTLAVGVAFSYWVLNDVECKRLQRYALTNEILHHCCRTLTHMLWLTFHNKDTFTMVFMLWVTPIDAARMSRPIPFMVYMATHVLLTLYRFSGDLAFGAPYIIGVIASSKILHEISIMKHESKEMSFELHGAHERMSNLATDIMKSIFNCFCDASAVLNSDLKLAETSPTLSAMLERQATEGKAFEDFVHGSDREEYRQQFSQPSQTSGSETEARGIGESSMAAALNLRSMRLHLQDSFSVPVDVQVFYAYFEDARERQLYFIGVSESWQPKQSTKPSAKSKRDVSKRINFETGRLESSHPLFPARDQKLLKQPRRLDATRDDAVEAAGPRQRRNDSPRPVRPPGNEFSPTRDDGCSLRERLVLGRGE